MSASAFPLGTILSMAALLLLCRPYLESRRPVASIALLAGMMLGPSMTGLVPAEVATGLEPLYSLAAGWLVLGAASSWNLGSVLRIGALRFLPFLAIAGLVPALLITLVPGAARPVPWILLAVIAACPDPSAAREALLSSGRPEPRLRRAPALASLAVGCALLASAFVPSAAGTTGTIERLARGGGALLLGAGLGVAFVFLMRIAQGKGLLIALLFAAAILGQGLAARLGLSPLAALFVSGVVLASDASRREMIEVVLQELERPFLVAVLLLAGAMVPFGLDGVAAASFLAATATFVVARSVVWLLIRQAGPGLAALPLSPIAPVIALQAGSGSGWPALVAVSFVIGEATWLVWRNR